MSPPPPPARPPPPSRHHNKPHQHNHNNNILSTSSSLDETAQRLRQLQQEEAALREQLRVLQFTHAYQTQFAFPAVVTWSETSQGSRRTDPTLIQHRLLEAGMLYDVPISIGETAQIMNRFVQDLEATGCFHAVQVKLGGTPPTVNADENDKDNSTGAPSQQQQPPSQRVTVVLDESKWYNLYLGGGLKQTSSSSSSLLMMGTGTSDHAFLPTAEFEAKLGLRNLSGCFDLTQLQYSLDTHNIATWWLQHERPLYTVMPTDGLQNWVLEQPAAGSQYWFRSKVVLDTQDFQMTRSYQEYQRLLSIGMYTNRHAGTAAAAAAMTTRQQQQLPSLQAGLEWNLLFRDLIPRRHVTLPYQYAASPQVVSQAGPSVKHSVLATVFGSLGIGSSSSSSSSSAAAAVDAMDSNHLDADVDDETVVVAAASHPHMDYKLQTEVAFPPGDVGFVKSQADVGLHLPLIQHFLSMHFLGSVGILKSLEFGGLTRPAGLSDRFLLGGPLQFRGFSPAGIGPRTPSVGGKSTTTSATATGDALGGDFLYKLTGIVSAPVPMKVLQSAGVTMFAFGQVGTCAHCINPLLQHELSVADVFASSRASAGIGLATNLFGPRLELTYSMPLRYGPMDHRRNFQVGMGFSMGG